MSRPRRPRALTLEERKLWAQVARAVVPLKGRAPLEAVEPEPAAAPPAPPASAPPRPSPARAPAPRLPPLAPLERRVKTELRRGARAVDAVLDLHGLRQDAAHHALIGFLRRAQAARLGLVLVITGKGAPGLDIALFEERGILRRVVPHWLRLPDLRPLVLGFEEAAPHHGGAGALYVRLRRSRLETPDV